MPWKRRSSRAMRGTMRALHMSCGEMLQQLSHSSIRPLANNASTCVFDI
jgi:hypothetical protein